MVRSLEIKITDWFQFLSFSKFFSLTFFSDGKKHGPPGANLFIFHLPNDYRDSDLEKLFSEFGEVISARVNTRPDGTSKGFGKELYFWIKVIIIVSQKDLSALIIHKKQTPQLQDLMECRLEVRNFILFIFWELNGIFESRQKAKSWNQKGGLGRTFQLEAIFWFSKSGSVPSILMLRLKKSLKKKKKYVY